jgi:hypothetical protein
LNPLMDFAHLQTHPVILPSGHFKLSSNKIS